MTEEQEQMWKRLSEPYIPPSQSNGNIAIGYDTANRITTGSNSIAIGYSAGFSEQAIQNIAIGYNSGN